MFSLKLIFLKYQQVIYYTFFFKVISLIKLIKYMLTQKIIFFFEKSWRKSSIKRKKKLFTFHS